ncbi:hypothetical protein SNL152K_1276 [Streptomyces sp. NL15-2K]|nr:hypothetical protein SNL152K_1276 [Streptomyces sp. NL15-2K]
MGMLSAQQFRCLVLRVLGGHLGLRHSVTAFLHQVFIDRQVIDFTGSACHKPRSFRFRACP